MRIHLLASLAFVLGGCAASVPKPGADANDTPIQVKQPPQKTGGATAPGCNGITERGVCQKQVAVYCDITTGSQRRIDCGALARKCVVDSTRGVRCLKPADTGPTCEAGLDLAGKCVAGTAWFCDPKEGTFSYNCTDDGFTCLDDARSCGVEGAFCCPPVSPPKVDSGVPRPDAGVGGCQGLDLRGECGGPDKQLLRYCDNKRLVELDCKARGLVCAVDSCVKGAFCCPKDQGADECAKVGRAGVCDPDGTLRFCGLDGRIRKVPCKDHGYTCQVNTCSPGEANCCDLTCDELPPEGKCEGPLIVFCNGDSEVDYFDCNTTSRKCCGTCGGGIPNCCDCPK